MILSPHCDDVPLSLGAALLNQSFGVEPLVPVFFSVSRYTKNGLGCAAEVTALRNSEELRASSTAGYAASFLGFPEPFVRPGFNSFNAVFDTRRNEEDDPIWPSVRKVTERLLTKNGGLTIVPLACGGHIDHRIVHRSVLAACATNPELQIGFYEDWPYCAFLTESEILARIPSLPGITFRPVLIDRGLEEKLGLLQVYQSQIRPEQLEGLRKYWNRKGGERVWLPETFEIKHKANAV